MDLIPLPLLLLAGVLLGAVLAAPISAYVRWHHGQPLGRVAWSTGLFAWVGLQLVVGLLLIDVTWPLTGYPMYAPPQPAGQPAPVLLLSGTTLAGRQLALPTNAFFPDTLDLQARVYDALQDPAQRDAMAARLLQQYNALQPADGDRLIALQVAVERRTLTPAGVARQVEALFTFEAGRS